MNIEKIKTTLEVYYIKSRTTLRTLVRLFGIVLVLIGGYNTVFAGGLSSELIILWPAIDIIQAGEGVARISDLIALFAGMILVVFR